MKKKVLIGLVLLALVASVGLVLQTWRPKPAIERQMEKLRVEVYPTLQLYENGELYIKTSIPALLRENAARVTLDETGWNCTRVFSPVKRHGVPGGEYDYSFLLESTPRALGANASVVFDFGTWSPDNYLLMPGEHEADPLRLTVGEEELDSGDLTVPSVGILFRKARKGMWIVMEPSTAKGSPGITFEESEDRATARLTFNAVRLREQVDGRMELVPSDDTVPHWKKDDAVRMRFLVLIFDCDSPAGLMEKLSEIRKHYAQ